MKKFYFLTIIFLTFVFTNKAFGAELFFEPQSNEIGGKNLFKVALNISANNPINALNIAIDIPDELLLVGTEDGNTVINFWIEKPTYYKQERELRFSGIISNGFTGKEGRLLVLIFSTKGNANSSEILFDREKTKILLNTPNAKEDKVVFNDIKLPIIPGRENIVSNLPDEELPEIFYPEYFRNDGIWNLAFATQDKGSGIAKYEIRESIWNTDNEKGWVEVESPYKIKDQNLTSYIFIRAIDNKGNMREMIVIPKNTHWLWGLGNVFTGAAIIIILGLLFYIVRKLFYKDE